MTQHGRLLKDVNCGILGLSWEPFELYTHKHIHIPQIIFIKPTTDFFLKCKEYEHKLGEKMNDPLILEKIGSFSNIIGKEDISGHVHFNFKYFFFLNDHTSTFSFSLQELLSIFPLFKKKKHREHLFSLCSKTHGEKNIQEWHISWI